MPDLQLGLIGDNILRSRAPRLHRLAGELAGLDVVYDRLVPGELGLDFDVVFERCAKSGFTGINVTYPYKERAAGKVLIEDPLVRRIAAVNTILFGPMARGASTPTIPASSPPTVASSAHGRRARSA